MKSRAQTGDWYPTRALRESDLRDHTPTIELALKEPTATAEDFHEAWVERRTAAGWAQSHRFDQKAKTHTQLVPFDKLLARDQKAERLGEAALRAAIADEHT